MPTTSPQRIPLAIKIAYTAFMAVLIPIYLKSYGPTNFLYFCGVAALMTLVAIWLESSLLLSAALVGAFFSQMLWVVDFFCELASWAGLFGADGFHLTGLTSYMFNPPFFLRFLSFYHFWLVFLLIYLVWSVGYDKRGVVLWMAIAWVLLTVCYVYMPPPSPSVDPPVTNPPITQTERGYIRGKVLEGPQANRQLKLVDERGKEIARTQTQADGAYVFERIEPGRYRVQLRDPDIPVNIDYVFNILSDEKAQEWMPPDLYFATYMAILMLGIYLPTHLLLRWLMPKREEL